MPHYVTLTPWESPVAYLNFAITWISSAVCIGVSVYFYRRNYGAWWLLVVFAFAMPLLAEVIHALSHGLPPLPYGLKEMHQVSPSLTITDIKSNSYLSSIQPLMAIAMFWGYLHDKKKRAEGPPTF